MANQELENETYQVPLILVDTMKDVLKVFEGDKSTPGYRRTTDIIKSGEVSYSVLKRIKNFFDTFEGDATSDIYRLNGGDAMKFWVENTLSVARRKISDRKKIMKNTGFNNQYIKTHDKDRYKTPTTINVPRVGTTARNIYNDEGVYEGLSILKIFNEIINENINKKDNE